MEKQSPMLRQLLLLTPFVSSFALGLDIYIPIVPQMVSTLATTPAVVQLTLSLFLLITGIGQLIIGPLSDQYGRKHLLTVASLCFAAGSLGCALSQSITELILFRAISAAGACGMLVTSFALVRDLYSETESGQMFSFINGAIGISPLFAPIIGGHLAVHFGWRSIFYFLAAIGLFALWISKKMIVETHPHEKRVPIDTGLWKRYASIATQRQFYIHAALAGLAEAIFFSFFSISPFLLIEVHSIPTEQFGYYFALFGAVISIGGFASGKLIAKTGIPATIAMGIALIFIGGLTMVGGYYLDILTLVAFLVPMAFACTGAMFLLGSAAAMALMPFGTIAGTAAAAFGAAQFGLSSLIGSTLMLFPQTSTLPYATTILAIAAASSSLFLISRYKSLENKALVE